MANQESPDVVDGVKALGKAVGNGIDKVANMKIVDGPSTDVAHAVGHGLKKSALFLNKLLGRSGGSKFDADKHDLGNGETYSSSANTSSQIEKIKTGLPGVTLVPNKKVTPQTLSLVYNGEELTTVNFKFSEKKQGDADFNKQELHKLTERLSAVKEKVAYMDAYREAKSKLAGAKVDIAKNGEGHHTFVQNGATLKLSEADTKALNNVVVPTGSITSENSAAVADRYQVAAKILKDDQFLGRVVGIANAPKAETAGNNPLPRNTANPVGPQKIDGVGIVNTTVEGAKAVSDFANGIRDPKFAAASPKVTPSSNATGVVVTYKDAADKTHSVNFDIAELKADNKKVVALAGTLAGVKADKERLLAESDRSAQQAVQGKFDSLTSAQSTFNQDTDLAKLRIQVTRDNGTGKYSVTFENKPLAGLSEADSKILAGVTRPDPITKDTSVAGVDELAKLLTDEDHSFKNRLIGIVRTQTEQEVARLRGVERLANENSITGLSNELKDPKYSKATPKVTWSDDRTKAQVSYLDDKKAAKNEEILASELRDPNSQKTKELKGRIEASAKAIDASDRSAEAQRAQEAARNNARAKFDESLRNFTRDTSGATLEEVNGVYKVKSKGQVLELDTLTKKPLKVPSNATTAEELIAMSGRIDSELVGSTKTALENIANAAKFTEIEFLKKKVSVPMELAARLIELEKRAQNAGPGIVELKIDTFRDGVTPRISIFNKTDKYKVDDAKFEGTGVVFGKKMSSGSLANLEKHMAGILEANGRAADGRAIVAPVRVERQAETAQAIEINIGGSNLNSKDFPAQRSVFEALSKVSPSNKSKLSIANGVISFARVGEESTVTLVKSAALDSSQKQEMESFVKAIQEAELQKAQEQAPPAAPARNTSEIRVQVGGITLSSAEYPAQRAAFEALSKVSATGLTKFSIENGEITYNGTGEGVSLKLVKEATLSSEQRKEMEDFVSSITGK